MSDLEYEPYDPAAEAYDARVEVNTPPLGGYLGWLWSQGLINRGDRTTCPAIVDSDRGHDELLDEFLAEQPQWREFADDIMVFSEYIDQIGMMLTDSTRLAEPGPDPFDHALFVADYYMEQSIGMAERRAEQCCPKHGG